MLQAALEAAPPAASSGSPPLGGPAEAGPLGTGSGVGSWYTRMRALKCGEQAGEACTAGQLHSAGGGVMPGSFGDLKNARSPQRSPNGSPLDGTDGASCKEVPVRHSSESSQHPAIEAHAADTQDDVQAHAADTQDDVQAHAADSKLGTTTKPLAQDDVQVALFRAGSTLGAAMMLHRTDSDSIVELL